MINIMIPKSLHRELKIKAVIENKTLQELAEELIRKGLAVESKEDK